MSKTRVIAADDHPIILAGLGMLIRAEDDLELAGEATTGPETLGLVHNAQPDIAVIDISLPQMNGIVLTRHIVEDCPSVGVIILTQHEDGSYLKQAMDAGARGYVLKRSAAKCLVQAIRGVLVGGLYIDPAMAAHMFPLARRASQSKTSTGILALTERESAVLKLVATGLTTKSIAQQLDLSLSSIETYKTRATAKVGLKTRAEIVRFASGQGWLATV